MNTATKMSSPRKPAGYAWLKKEYKLPDISHDHISWLASINTRSKDGVEEVFPARKFTPADTLGGHLEFALKYDGVNLQILHELFHQLKKDEIVEFINENSGGIYVRRIWFLYEFLTDITLPIDSLTSGNYIELLNPNEYCVRDLEEKSVRKRYVSSRHRVLNNLLGNKKFCPMVRKLELDWNVLHEKALAVLGEYDNATIIGVINYLYTKETRSSFAIENEKPSKDKVERFGKALRHAKDWKSLDKSTFLDLQKIMLNRPADDYRDIQNYVGETIGMNEYIHFIPPKPEDVPSLMDGLKEFSDESDSINPIIVAAAASFGFVFIHPFEDGNGRTHRFMIHYILSSRGVTPNDVVFPISATMLENMKAYDACLESFSVPTKELIEYEADEDWTIDVKNETAYLYRYFNATPMVDYLYRCIEDTIEVGLKQELELLNKFRSIKKLIDQEMDVSNIDLDRFINFCHQNNGTLSKKKKDRFFQDYDNEQIERMEEIYQSYFT
jgi:Fic/DOC family protein